MNPINWNHVAIAAVIGCTVGTLSSLQLALSYRFIRVSLYHAPFAAELVGALIGAGFVCAYYLLRPEP